MINTLTDQELFDLNFARKLDRMYARVKLETKLNSLSTRELYSLSPLKQVETRIADIKKLNKLIFNVFYLKNETIERVYCSKNRIVFCSNKNSNFLEFPIIIPPSGYVVYSRGTTYPSIEKLIEMINK